MDSGHLTRRQIIRLFRQSPAQVAGDFVVPRL
jgi:hypothetical protein